MAIAPAQAVSGADPSALASGGGGPMQPPLANQAPMPAEGTPEAAAPQPKPKDRRFASKKGVKRRGR